MIHLQPSIPMREPTERWSRVLFSFKGYEDIKGNLRTIKRGLIATTFYSMLPIVKEAIVLDNVEILIKLDPVLTQKISYAERTHEALPGDIIYRPQLPSISIFADYYEIYEPVVKIGMVDRADLDKVRRIAENVKEVMLVKISRLEF